MTKPQFESTRLFKSIFKSATIYLHQPRSNSLTSCIWLDIEVVQVDGLADPGVVDEAEEREADKFALPLCHLVQGLLDMSLMWICSWIYLAVEIGILSKTVCFQLLHGDDWALRGFFVLG